MRRGVGLAHLGDDLGGVRVRVRVRVRGRGSPHLGDDLGGVVVLDRVLAEEVEVEHVLGRALLHMLHAQRAAAHLCRLLSW